MNKIKVKLMIFIITIFILMNGVSAFLYLNHKHTLAQYDHLLDRFFLINDISQVSQDTFDSMNSFLLHQTQDDLTSFYTYRKKLKEKQRALKGTIMNSKNSIAVKNYEMLIGSFVEETDVTIGLFMSEQIESYPTRQAESFKLLSFLHDRTLRLLDDELTNFNPIIWN